MTHFPDDPHRDHRPDGIDQPDPEPPADPGAEDAYDEDAIWRSIIENYGERPEMGAPPPDPGDGAPPVEPSPVVEPEPARSPFDRSYLDALETEATWEDEGHFVPPEPPPLPKLEPRRKLAWAGLFGAPLLLLLAVVFGWVYPTWLVFLLVAGFVGGFVYLVATMPRSRHDDWGGDDGAVV